jgi:carbon starvation protein
MRALKVALWVGVAAAGALAFAVITRLYRPSEHISALWLVVAAVCTFLISYRFYGAWMAAKIFALDDRRRTPAVRLADGHDYDVTNRWVLFGHHFAAIAGAGPLVGPVLAAQFGYLPGALWILVGSALGGAVHDFVILVASVRRNGSSLAAIARKEVGPVAGFCASLAILFIIVIALAGLGLAVVNALADSPWAMFTIAMTIPIALYMGVHLTKLRPGRVAEATIIGVTLLVITVIGGHAIIGTRVEQWFMLSRNGVVLALALYGFIAAVLPVWLLLAPRGYLSTYMKIGIILILAVGIVLIAPELKMPAVTRFIHGDGPVIPGTLFPFMFITIACGAISGGHALVSSGTTPKMMEHESEALPIAFGGMLVEGVVSMMALIAAGILIPGDYFAINSMLSADALTQLGFAPERITELSAMVGTNVANRPGGAVSLAVGMASVFSSLPGMKHLMAYWYNFALLFEALFILTTVDTFTRIGRFLVQEMVGALYAPFKRTDWWPGYLAASAAVVAAWGGLIYSGSIATIWPVFGISNQLLATLAFSIGTTVLIKMRKARSSPITMVPMVFMAFTTLDASYELVRRFLRLAVEQPREAFTYRLDAGMVIIMAALAFVILIDSAIKWWQLLTGRRPLTTSEVPFEEAAAAPARRAQGAA